MTEPFADADTLPRVDRQLRVRARPAPGPEPPRLLEPNPTPTLILYGPEDHVIPRDFPAAHGGGVPQPRRPVRGPGAGHFLQWERADVLNGALRWLCL